jgi:hypothetical protein
MSCKENRSPSWFLIALEESRRWNRSPGSHQWWWCIYDIHIMNVLPKQVLAVVTKFLILVMFYENQIYCLSSLEGWGDNVCWWWQTKCCDGHRHSPSRSTIWINSLWSGVGMIVTSVSPLARHLFIHDSDKLVSYIYEVMIICRFEFRW